LPNQVLGDRQRATFAFPFAHSEWGLYDGGEGALPLPATVCEEGARYSDDDDDDDDDDGDGGGGGDGDGSFDGPPRKPAHAGAHARPHLTPTRRSRAGAGAGAGGRACDGGGAGARDDEQLALASHCQQTMAVGHCR
jgi:hypothetical protein